MQVDRRAVLAQQVSAEGRVGEHVLHPCLGAGGQRDDPVKGLGLFGHVWALSVVRCRSAMRWKLTKRRGSGWGTPGVEESWSMIEALGPAGQRGRVRRPSATPECVGGPAHRV